MHLGYVSFVGRILQIVSIGLFFFFFNKTNLTGLENMLSHFHGSYCLKSIPFLVEELDCRVYRAMKTAEKRGSGSGRSDRFGAEKGAPNATV